MMFPNGKLPVIYGAGAVLLSMVAFDATLPAQSVQQNAPDILLADFEGESYAGWTTKGVAFGSGPVRNKIPGQSPVGGFLGKGYASSFDHGDQSTGSLTSPPFAIERHYLRFLIGGGWYYGKTGVNLIVDGRIVRTAVGAGDKEELSWRQWNVSEWIGKKATIEIVDWETRSLGHINVDHFVESDKHLPGLVTDATREITVSKRYLILPVKNGATRRAIQLLASGKIVREFDIELAESAPDWWAFVDLALFQGQLLTIKVDQMSEGSIALSSVEQSDEIKGSEPLYHEKLRPQFHFSARRGWMNDPNGLVYYRGEYHLFYQHNPYGLKWGNKHWGHAISRDLLHWDDLGDTLFPDENGFPQSGSAVVDWNNTAGFARDGEKAVVCFYTGGGSYNRASAGRASTQCMAYSVDQGRSWSKYSGNPVVPHIAGTNRDPKVIWYEEKKKWVMALYLEKNEFTFLSSSDLKNWERTSNLTFPGTIECPELFELPVDGDIANRRWIFFGGNGRYLVGDFDGNRFVAKSGPYQMNHGSCFYAAQTFSDIPSADGRRILVGWGKIAPPNTPFVSQMDIPVELSLRTTPEGLRIFSNPVREIECLRTAVHSFPEGALTSKMNPLDSIHGDLFEIDAEVNVGTAQQVGFRIRGATVIYDAARGILRCNADAAPLVASKGVVHLHLLVDRTSIEIFGNGGALYMSTGFVPDESNLPLEMFAVEGEARIETLKVYELASIWQGP